MHRDKDRNGHPWRALSPVTAVEPGCRHCGNYHHKLKLALTCRNRHIHYPFKITPHVALPKYIFLPIFPPPLHQPVCVCVCVCTCVSEATPSDYLISWQKASSLPPVSFLLILLHFSRAAAFRRGLSWVPGSAEATFHHTDMCLETGWASAGWDSHPQLLSTGVQSSACMAQGANLDKWGNIFS